MAIDTKKFSDMPISQNGITTGMTLIALELGASVPNVRVSEAQLRNYILDLAGQVPTDPELGKTGLGITAIGDSITEAGRTGVNGWLAKACYFFNQGYRFRGEFAIGGSETSSGITVQMPKVLAMNPRPRACVVAFGSNHLSTNQVATGIAELKSICQTLVDNGIQPILWTVPPRGDLPQSQTLIESWNTQLRAFQAQKGWPLVDAWAILKNPNSYTIFPTTATGDGTHLTAHGCALLGKAVATAMASWTTIKDAGIVFPTAAAPVAGNLAPNPLFTQGGTTGLADGAEVQANGVAVPSLVAAVAPAEGNWQRFTIPANSPSVGGTPALCAINVGEVEGEKYTIAMRMRSVNGAADVSAPFSQALGIYFSNASWGNAGSAFLINTPGLPTEDGILYLRDVAIPAGAKHLSILAAGSDGTNPVQNVPRYVEAAQLIIIKQ